MFDSLMQDATQRIKELKQELKEANDELKLAYETIDELRSELEQNQGFSGNYKRGIK